MNETDEEPLCYQLRLRREVGPLGRDGSPRSSDAALLAVVVLAKHLTVRSLRLTAQMPGFDVVGLHPFKLEVAVLQAVSDRRHRVGAAVALQRSEDGVESP